MINAIFFDIDDTLYDSTSLTTMARRNSIRAMIDAGLPVSDENKISKLLDKIIKKFGSNYGKHYDELLKALHLPWNPEIIAAGVVAYEHTKAGYLKPFPRVVPTLLKLKREYKLGVVSNGIAVKQWEKLIGLGIHHFFDVVVTSGELGFEKPQKVFFEFAVKALRCKPEECVIVGDNVKSDILGGNRAGMHTIRVLTGKHGGERPRSRHEKPDFEIKDVSEIFKILRKIK